jgi:hypothetical protein
LNPEGFVALLRQNITEHENREKKMAANKQKQVEVVARLEELSEGSRCIDYRVASIKD